MRRSLVLVILFSMSLGGAASALDVARPDLAAAFARRVMRARTPRDADRLRARFDGARVAALSCSWQRANRLAPVACYEPLSLEREWGVRSVADFARARADLDAACRHGADRYRVPGADRDLKFVGRDCAARVREARAARAYRAEDPGWSED